MGLGGHVVGHDLQPLPPLAVEGVGPFDGAHPHEPRGQAVHLGGGEQGEIDALVVEAHQLQGPQDLALHGRLLLDGETPQQGVDRLRLPEVAQGPGRGRANPRPGVGQGPQQGGQDGRVLLAQVQPVEGLHEVDARPRRKAPVVEGAHQRLHGPGLGHVQLETRLLGAVAPLDDAADGALHGVAAGPREQGQAGDQQAPDRNRPRYSR